MKTTIKILVILVFAVVGLGANVQAQSDQTALTGSEYTYSVAERTNFSYAWEITKGGLDASGDVVLTGANTKDLKVKWNTPGTYILTLTETSEHNCSVITKSTYKVLVEDGVFAWSALNLGKVCHTEIQTMAVTITLSGGVAPYKATYEMLDEAGTPVKFTKEITSDNGGVFTIDNTVIDDLNTFVVNRGDDSYTFDIKLINITDKYNTPIPDYTITGMELYRNPNSSTITHD